MSTVIILVVLCALVAVLAFRPLWHAAADRPMGVGLERPSPHERQVAERERIRTQLHDLDEAHAEAKIDSVEHEAERARLAAVVAVGMAVQHADEGATVNSNGSLPRTYPVSAVLGWGTVLAITLTVALVVEGNDIDRTVPATSTEAATDEQPDVGAMVARLEARVRSGQAGAEDIAMLERTYEVLGRTDELTGMFRVALSENPNNAVVLMALGIRQFENGGKLASVEAEEAFDRLLALVPNLPEAMWFKSLLLVRRQEVEAATTLLHRIADLAAEDSEAHKAASELLVELDKRRDSSTRDN